jgi:hypothetical protein
MEEGSSEEWGERGWAQSCWHVAGRVVSCRHSVRHLMLASLNGPSLQEDVAAEALGLKLEDLKLDQQVAWIFPSLVACRC